MNLAVSFLGRGPLLIHLQGRQDLCRAGKTGPGIHPPTGLPSCTWKPYSSTAFLTLASSLGSRNFCSTHTCSRHCSAQEGQASPRRTPQKQHLQLLTFTALQGEVEASLWGQTTPAKHARADTIQHQTVVSEHKRYLYNHCTAIVLYDTYNTIIILL